MTHYHDDLIFGSFITPTSEQPHLAVALAQASEELQLDLVSFQDHPYQPSFLDTWSLLAFVLARTTRITVAPNVANLPRARPPCWREVRRAWICSATVDLLSVLEQVPSGTGLWRWAPRGDTPKESIQALGEAIDILQRHLGWHNVTGALRVDGEYYHVHGATARAAPRS